MLGINILAPDFELDAMPDKKLSLHELKGKNVILAFYPADWSPVCSDRWLFIMKCDATSANTMRNLLAFQSMGNGVIPHSAKPGICILLYWQILNPKEQLPGNMVYTMKKQAVVRELFLFWMKRASSGGV